MSITTDHPYRLDSTEQATGVSWGAIAAGAVVAAALSLALLALGVGLGLSAISSWSGSGASATTFKIGSGVYLAVVAVLSSTVGGYMAARLRTKWTTLNPNEVFFRDTAHGLITWAFATVLSAAALGSATTSIVGGTAHSLIGVTNSQAAAPGPVDGAVDLLFRSAAPAGAAPQPVTRNEARAEMTRLFAAKLGDGGDLSSEDRAYAARVVAAQSGLNPADAERRISEVIIETKRSLDTARRSAAQLSLWLTAALFLGAFAATLAAVEGGQLRDGTWNGRKLTPRPI
jgi:hypothetical protein